MLRLVHPAKQGQGTRTPKGRKSAALFPTDDECARIRAAIRNLRFAYGGYAVLASVTGISKQTLASVATGQDRASYSIAVAIARAGGIPVEQVLSGRPHVAGACAVCGRKGAP